MLYGNYLYVAFFLFSFSFLVFFVFGFFFRGVFFFGGGGGAAFLLMVCGHFRTVICWNIAVSQFSDICDPLRQKRDKVAVDIARKLKKTPPLGHFINLYIFYFTTL